MKMPISLKVSILATALIAGLSSCTHDPFDKNGGKNSGNQITFVVSIPTIDNKPNGGTRAATGGNGHFPEGVPAEYCNYSPDADTTAFGTAFGGYPDAETETEAFERAVASMAANYGKAGRPVQPQADINGATRAITEGNGQEYWDNAIGELTVALFDNNGNFFKSLKISSAADADAPFEAYPDDLQRKQFTLTLPDGNYKAIFTANSRAAVLNYEAALINNPALAPIAEFRAFLEVQHGGGAWVANPMLPNYKAFPMASKEIELNIPNTRDYEMYPVELIRALAKINLICETPNFQIEQLRVCNFSSRGYICPSPEWRKGMSLFTPSFANEFISLNTGALPNAIVSMVERDGVLYYECVDEIFVFEQRAYNNNTNNESKDALCLLVRARPMGVTGQHGGTLSADLQWYRINLLKTDPADGKTKLVNILRNYRYDIRIKNVTSGGYATDQEAYDNLPGGLDIEIEAWNDQGGEMNEHTYNGEYQLTTDRSVLILSPESGATAEMKVYTDYSGGWSNTAVRFPYDTDFTVSTDSDHNSANGSQPTLLTLEAPSANNTASIRRAVFTIRAGALQKEIIVIQLPSPDMITTTSDAVTGYVGAFWKHDQRGERLIGLKPDKEWSAFVLGGTDWVVMDAKTSLDAGVLTTSGPENDGNDSDFEKTHPVKSTAIWAHGTTGSAGGYFRIGLRNSYSPTPDKPARYAKVLVVDGDATNMKSTISNNSRILYLRQGEGADYLMRPSDTGGIGGSRSEAQKISPYNLTIPSNLDNTSLAQFENQGAVEIGFRGGEFTKYPTQAGAFFKGMGPHVFYAYHPTAYVAETIEIWGDEVIDFPEFDVMIDETCPSGYRRPSVDGIGNNATGGEMVQSLYRNPSAYTIWDSNFNRYQKIFTNAVGDGVEGYYADGFFDRRRIETGELVEPGSQVAYKGNLVFNSNSGASLFLPFSGRRSSETQALLSQSGEVGYYWSASFPGFDENGLGANSGWQMYNFQGFLNISDTWQQSDAVSVRCVKGEVGFAFEPDPANIPLVPDDGGSLDIIEFDQASTTGGLTVKATVTTTGSGINGNTKHLVHHAAWIEYHNGNDYVPATPGMNLAGKALRVTFPKVYYPNRDIAISAKVKVTVSDGPAGGSFSKTFDVGQEALVAKQLTVHNYQTNQGFGSISGTTSYYIDAYRNILYDDGNYVYTPAGYLNNWQSTIPDYYNNTEREYNYLHVVINDFKSNYDWAKINNWTRSHDGLLAIIGHANGGGPTSPTVNNTMNMGPNDSGNRLNINNNPFFRAGYVANAVYHNTVNLQQTGRVNTDPNVTNKKVYQYLMGQSPVDPINATNMTGFYYDALNYHIPISNLPSSGIPMMVNTSTATAVPTIIKGAASFVIDVEAGFLFMGESEHFNLPYTPYMTDTHKRFLENLMHYVKNTAKYGTHFTDLLIEDDNNGVNPRSFLDQNGRYRVAQPAPWSTYWGDNAELPGSAGN